MSKKLIFLLSLLCLLIFELSAQQEITEQSADMGESQSLEKLARQNFIIESKQKLEEKRQKLEEKQRNKIAYNSPKKIKKTKKKIAKIKKIKIKKVGKKRSFKQKSTKKKVKKIRKGWSWSWFKNWRIGKLLDLDWLLVALVILIPAILLALLVSSVLSFFEMFFLVLGFGFAIFAFSFLVSESNGRMASYQYFVKFGLFTWIGILAIFAGFAALFGATGGNFITYLLIGAILGVISFIVSLIVGDSILNGF